MLFAERERQCFDNVGGREACESHPSCHNTSSFSSRCDTKHKTTLNKMLWAIVKGEKNYQRSGQTTMWSLSRFSTDRSAIWMARQGHEQINREHGCHFNRCSKAMLEMNSQRAASCRDANIKPSASTLWSVSLCVHPNMVSQQHQNTQYSSTNTKSEQDTAKILPNMNCFYNHIRAKKPISTNSEFGLTLMNIDYLQ